MSLPPGASIGHYRIVALLGAGGMGEVYRAQDTRLKREVALKVLPTAFANDRKRLARVTREAELLAALNHPNIATIYGVEDGSLIMELVEGESPHGPMPFDAAWNIVSQVADALAYAHDRGIVHRDLKPSNLIVTPEGVVKLLDFGLAKAFTPISDSPSLEEAATLTLGTRAGVILGTAAYMSPEHARGKAVDRRTDIWAFGVVFYELLTGQRMFQAENAVETLSLVLTKEPDLTNVPARARALLQRCLEKDPKKRLRDIGEVRHYLDAPDSPVLPRGARALLPWAVAAAALLFAASTWFTQPAPTLPVIRSYILPPDQSSFRCFGDDGGPVAISPDGRRLAFTALTPEGKVLLWVRPLDSLTPQPLAGTEGAMSPFWSPNSRSLGFFAEGKLKRIDATGGTVTVLADAPTNRGGSWGRDDVILFAPLFTSAIWRVPAGGGTAIPATRLDEKQQEISHRWPFLLPDGKHFLFTSRNKGTFFASLDGAQPPRRLLAESTNPAYSSGALLYNVGATLYARPFDPKRGEFTGPATTLTQSVQGDPNSNRGYFAVSDHGLLAYHTGMGDAQLVWVDRTGNRSAAMGTPGPILGVEIAPDGKRAAAILRDSSGGMVVWNYDLLRGVRTRLAFAPRVTGIAWEAGGKRLAVGTERQGSYEINAKDPEGSGKEELLLRSNIDVLPTDWPARGPVLQTRSPETGQDISYLPAAGRAPLPVLHGKGDEIWGKVSPDGRYLLYVTYEPGDGILQSYVADFPSGENRRQVATIESNQARWNPNGKEIVIASRTKVFSVPVRDAGGALEFDPPKLLFTSRVDCVELEISCFDISRDGARFLVIDPVGPPPLITLVQNWK